MKKASFTCTSTHSSLYFVIICAVLCPPLGGVVVWALIVLPFGIMAGDGIFNAMNPTGIVRFFWLSYLVGLFPALMYSAIAIVVSKKLPMKPAPPSLSTIYGFSLAFLISLSLTIVYFAGFNWIVLILILPLIFGMLSAIPAYICTRMALWSECFPIRRFEYGGRDR